MRFTLVQPQTFKATVGVYLAQTDVEMPKAVGYSDLLRAIAQADVKIAHWRGACDFCCGMHRIGQIVGVTAKNDRLAKPRCLVGMKRRFFGVYDICCHFNFTISLGLCGRACGQGLATRFGFTNVQPECQPTAQVDARRCNAKLLHGTEGSGKRPTTIG